MTDKAEAARAEIGHWIPGNRTTCNMVFICSVCGGKAWSLNGGNSNRSLGGKKRECGYQFCPHCKAKMEGGHENESK